MKPVRKNLFGVSRPLTGKEARLLLRRVVQGVPAKDDSPVPKVRINIRVPKEELPKSDILNTIWQLLTEQYLYREKLKPDEAAYRAAEALVESLGDPYTVFMRPVKNEQFQTQIQGEITGIGAQVELRSGVLVIVSPLKGSPAEKAGLLPGDEIHAVDGESLKGLGLEDAVGKVRGPKGTTVKLRIHRNGAEFDVTVIRDVVRVPEIEISFQGSIAIVKLHQFGQITERDLRSLMEKVQEQKPTGLVLDLRNNPGGLLHAAEVVLSNFVPQGSPVAVILSPEQEYTELTDDPPTIGASIPVVVLVNKGSASASEIVAGALQDAKRARVIGEQTFGKGYVQQVLQFNDGSSLKMTIAEYLTPSRHKVDGIGITPDRVIPMEAGGRDTQLLEALDLLR
jgi:carboxyl-terminal processing protease